MWRLPHPQAGVDTADFPATIRRSRTGPRPRLTVFAGPSFSLSFADHLSQPRAGVRTCRVPRVLREPADGRCNGGREPARAHAACAQAHGWRTCGSGRAQRSGSAISLGRHLPGERLRLLRPCLLGVRATRYQSPTQLLRTLRPRSSGTAQGNEAGGRALLLRPGSRRHLPGAWTHGSRTSFRQSRSSRSAESLPRPACRYPAHPELTRILRGGQRPKTRRSASSTARSSLASSRPADRPRRCESTTVVCSTRTRVSCRSITIVGRKLAGRALVEVGATSVVLRSRNSSA